MHPAEKLRKLGYEVQQFSVYHFRVEGVLDFWMGSRGCKWWYRTTDERGKRPPDQIVFFVQHILGDPGALKIEIPKEEFVRRLVSIGWSEKEANEAWNTKQSQVV
jgi:hypothetical protein